MGTDPEYVKAMLLIAAYEGALAVIGPATSINVGGVATPVNPDDHFNDPGVRAKAVAIFEEAKIQYQPLLAAWQDQTGIFPDPKPLGSNSPTPPVPLPPGTVPGLAALAAAIASGNAAAVTAAAANVAPDVLAALHGVLGQSVAPKP